MQKTLFYNKEILLEFSREYGDQILNNHKCGYSLSLKSIISPNITHEFLNAYICLVNNRHSLLGLSNFYCFDTLMAERLTLQEPKKVAAAVAKQVNFKHYRTLGFPAMTS